jgi:hypothetical protein
MQCGVPGPARKRGDALHAHEATRNRDSVGYVSEWESEEGEERMPLVIYGEDASSVRETTTQARSRGD